MNQPKLLFLGSYSMIHSFNTIHSSGSCLARFFNFCMLVLVILHSTETDRGFMARKANDAPFTLKVQMLHLQVLNMSSNAEAL